MCLTFNKRYKKIWSISPNTGIINSITELVRLGISNYLIGNLKKKITSINLYRWNYFEKT